MIQSRLTQPLKYWGGKYFLANEIIDIMPRHLHYVEPYGGGLAVLLRKDPCDPRHQWGEKSNEQGVSEVVNDIHGALQNFWNVLKSEETYAEFQRLVDATPFSENEYRDAEDRMIPQKELDVDAAVAYFVRCRQSRAGGFYSFAPISRNRTSRRMNEQAAGWTNAVDGLPAIHDRLQGVVILNRDAQDVIRQEDGEKTLFYLDPPYVHDTRAATDRYRHEMSECDHLQLLETVKNCKGKVMLSGYPNDIYDINLSDWNRHDFEIDNKASGEQTKRKMTECVWCNF